MDTHLSARHYQALLKGLIFASFLPTTAPEFITVANVKANIFAEEHFESGAVQPSAREESVQDDILRNNIDVLCLAATNDWTVDQVRVHLETTAVTPAGIDAFLKVWGREASHINEVLTSTSTFGTALRAFQWRVDNPTSTSSGRKPPPRAMLHLTLSHPPLGTVPDASCGEPFVCEAPGTVSSAASGAKLETLLVDATEESLARLVAACVSAQRAIDAASGAAA